MTRLTVYRHFPDLDTLFEACRAHWRTQNPPPDASIWTTIPGMEDRARRAFSDLYRWFADHTTELTPIYRDMDASPASSQARMRADLGQGLVGRFSAGCGGLPSQAGELQR